MASHSRKLVLRWVGIICVLISAFYLFNRGLAGVGRLSVGEQILLATASPTPTTVPPKFTIHFPNVIRHALGPRVELLAVWMADQDGNPAELFLLNDQAQYIAQIFNSSDKTIKADLRWILVGPCGETIVSNGSITLVPGEQQSTRQAAVPNCPGIYTVTAELSDLGNVLSESSVMVANPLSLVAIENNQGFDKCTVPTISQMETWWVHSPYWAVNMYIGGISRACDQVNLTPYWMNAISQQGWTFIPTWVGPQAPCSDFRHRISSNGATAYLEGKDEAEMAVSAAIDLGLWGDMVIYYDLEGYTGNAACRNTVASFMKGWVERIHQLGYQAGVYGSPCRSYLIDFAEINPTPDDVWIAGWLTPPQYRPDATVWLTGSAEDCLPNTLWVDHQRIRQYAGGHVETYGGLSFSIDNNAMDGEVTVLPTPAPAPTTQASANGTTGTSSQLASQPMVRAMQLVGSQAGWALSGEQLLWTEDGGTRWKEITPGIGTSSHLLAVTFTSPVQGWVVRQSAGEGDQPSLEILATSDSGQTWQPFQIGIPEDPGNPPISAAYLHFVDDQTGFLSLKLQSSSAFSLGRLFATENGGHTWEERSLPLGEPVSFLDARRGWVAGGPGGDQLYHTRDGGRTWQPQSVDLPFSGAQDQVFLGLPRFRNAAEGTLPVTLAGLDPRLLVYSSQDGGETWSISEQIDLAGQPSMASPFNADLAGAWWAATPGKERLWSSRGLQDKAAQLEAMGLPPGVIALDFLDSQSGWALAQAGICQGEKTPVGSTGGQPLRCTSQSYLLSSADGGQTWKEISP